MIVRSCKCRQYVVPNALCLASTVNPVFRRCNETKRMCIVNSWTSYSSQDKLRPELGDATSKHGTARPEGRSDSGSIVIAIARLTFVQYCPNKDLSQDLLDIQHSPLTTRMSPSPAATPTSTHGAQTPVELVDEHDIDSDEEEANARETISDYLKGLHITPSLPPLMGKSSTLMLLRTVLEYRNGDPSERQSYMAGTRPSDTIPFWESYTLRVTTCLVVPVYDLCSRIFPLAVGVSSVRAYAPFYIPARRPDANSRGQLLQIRQ